MARLGLSVAVAVALAACGTKPVSTAADAATPSADASSPGPDAAVSIDAAPDAEAPRDASLAPDAASHPDAGAPDASPVFVAGCGLLASELSAWTIDRGAFTAGAAPPDAGVPGLVSTTAAAMYQDVDLAPLGIWLDEGDRVAHFSALTRVAGEADTARLEMTAFNETWGPLATVQSVPLENTFWMARAIGLRLPPGTRRLRVHVTASAAGAGLAPDLCVDRNAPDDDRLAVGPYLVAPQPDAITVLWELAEPGPAGSVSYGIGALTGSAPASADGLHRRVRLTGLQPDTEYQYRIEGQGEAGTTHRFRTPPNATRPFSFVVWGDNQDGVETFRGLATQMAALAPEFALSLGDQVESGTEARYHRQFLLPLRGLAESVPLWSVPGNHNRGDDPLLSQFDAHLPQPGSSSVHCFGFRHANAYFVVLDSSVDLAVSQACLNTIFGSSPFRNADLRVVALHEPPRVEYWAGGGNVGNAWVRDYLDPLLALNGVDLALTGHVHLYAWGPPKSGVTWVTSGGGGGGLEPPTALVRDWPEITETRFRHHFLHATVSGKTMVVRAIADTGEELHRFQIGP